MSTTDLSFAATSLPAVALSFMNEVHHEELNLVHELLAQLDAEQTDESVNKAANEAISAQLAQWLAHTQAHFERENFLMQTYHFFAYPLHAAEHELALQQLSAVQSAWEQLTDRAALRAYIQTWRNWLQQHISTMDFVTAQFLSQFPIPNNLKEIDQLREHEDY